MTARSPALKSSKRALPITVPNAPKDERASKALRAKVIGQMLTDTALNNALVASQFSEKKLALDGSVDFTGVADAITVEIEKIQSNDLSGVEAMLIAQAIGLQNLYTQMVTRAAKSGTAEALNTLGALGLRAQSQSRATLQTLIDLKQPRVTTVFAKSANVANGGPQQVNISGAAVAGALAHEAAPPNELNNEVSNVLDPRAPRAVRRGNSTLAAVEIGVRSSHRSGEISVISER